MVDAVSGTRSPAAEFGFGGCGGGGWIAFLFHEDEEEVGVVVRPRAVVLPPPCGGRESRVEEDPLPFL
jgi:hypothetical protein